MEFVTPAYQKQLEDLADTLMANRREKTEAEKNQIAEQMGQMVISGLEDVKF